MFYLRFFEHCKVHYSMCYYGGVAVLSGKGCDRDSGHVSSSLFYPDFGLNFFRGIVHPFLQFSIFPGFELLFNLEFRF